MKILFISFTLATLIGALSCAPGDAEKTKRAKEYLTAHPHPFTLQLTDSSIAAAYVWKDTLREYSISLWIPEEDGILRQWYPQDEFTFPPLVKDTTWEWPFAALGLDSLPEDTHINFGRPGSTTEFGYAWVYNHGRLIPVLISPD